MFLIHTSPLSCIILGVNNFHTAHTGLWGAMVCLFVPKVQVFETSKFMLIVLEVRLLEGN